MTPIVVNGLFSTQRLTGVQRYALEVVRSLRQREADFSVRTPGRRMSHSAWTAHLWEQIVLPREISDGQLLWSPTNTGPVYFRNQVVTVHDGAVLSHPEWFSRRYVVWRRWALPRLVRNAKHVITVSNFAKRHICEHTGIPESRISTVPNGINHDIFRPASATAVDDIRRRHGLEAEYVLSVGSISPRKNVRRLLQAWECLEQSPIGADLVIVGGSAANFAAHPLATHSRSVHFLGHIPDEDLPALYSGAVAFVYPSLFEGFGLPPLEAMACGTPVVTSNAASLPEVVGDAAVLIDPHDVCSLTEGIRRLVKDRALQETLRGKGLERAKQFTWGRTAELTWDVLQQAARSG